MPSRNRKTGSHRLLQVKVIRQFLYQTRVVLQGNRQTEHMRLFAQPTVICHLVTGYKAKAGFLLEIVWITQIDPTAALRARFYSRDT